MAGQQGERKDKMGVSLKTTRKKPETRESPLVTFVLPYVPFHYNQKLMFYKDKGRDFEDMVAKLKDGLKRVLKKFYPLAGKLTKDEKGVFWVEYDDDKAVGVEVVKAEAVAVKDLAAEEGTSIFKGLIPYDGIPNLEGLPRPLLAIQLTKLKDGIAIGCAFNHAVLDGISTWNFITSWAQACRDKPAESAPPIDDRTRSRNSRVKLDLSLPPDPSSLSSNGDPAPPPPLLREKVFRFSESSIDKLKSAISKKPPADSSTPFSTFQALSVHIWRHVTEARDMERKEQTVCTVFVDCRTRVDQPLAKTYFGNLVQAIFPKTEARFLTESPPEVGAGIMQKAIRGHDAKAIEKRNKQRESQAKEFQFEDARTKRVAFGSLLGFKVYDVDFGWGRPEGVRSGSNNRFDGAVCLYRGKSGGRSIDVEITLEAGVMKKLEKDKKFLEP